MANTQPVRFTFSVLDELGTRAAITDYALMDPTATVANLIAAWGAQATLLDAVTGCQITGGGVEMSDTNAQMTALGLKSAPVAGSRVEQTGVFNLSNSSTPRRFGIAVAGILDSLISAGRIVITEGGPVDLWLDLIEAAGTATTPQYANTAGQSLVALVDAFLSFRKRRKQLSRSSRELGPD